MAKKKPAASKKSITPSQAEALTKKAAASRTITIALTADQLKSLSEQWRKLNPAEAAQLIFTDGASQTSNIKVAGYSYHGNTCCA